MHPLIPVVVVLLCILAVHLLLTAFHVVDPWRSITLVVAIIGGMFYLLRGI